MKPKLIAGATKFSVAVRDVMNDLVSVGFPPANIPQVCSALRKRQFLREHHLEIESIDGPPQKMSPTVVYHYRVINPEGAQPPLPTQAVNVVEQEDSESWALRVTEKIRGLLKDEIAAFGGTEGFIRWVRSEDEDAQ
ncbi:hypothetical protein [Terracidiphilus sp.]|uniref:hypothetical protein n=1 Tax=Terracidiphilus sp. TaxID=1964191 RepID=UPI003C2624F2